MKSFICRQLRRLYFWCLKILARRTADIRIFALLIAVSRIRSRFDLSLTGDDEKLDNELHNIVCGFFDQNTKPPSVISKSEYAHIAQWLENDEESKNDRKMCLRVSHWLAERIRDEEKARLIVSMYQSLYGQPPEPIKDDDIDRIRSEFKKRLKDEQNAFLDSKARLIDLRLERLTPILPWISLLSLLFIFAGYLHTSLVYGHFGIETNQFFSVNDYLAGSVREIQSALFSVSGFLVGILLEHRNKETRTKYELNRIMRYDRIFELLSWIGFLAFLYHLYNGSLYPGLRTIAPFFIMVVAGRPIFYVVRKCIKNPPTVYRILLILIFFFSSLWLSADSKIQDIKNGNSGMDFEIEAGTKKFTQENSVFIGGTSRYIFLRAREGNIDIIPIGKIERIKIPAVEEISGPKRK